MTKNKTLFFAIALALPMASVFAGAPSADGLARTAEPASGALSPQQRGAAISTFVRRWGPYVEQTYGVDVHTWSQRMVSQFAAGDSTNIQRSLQRRTFEGAMAELNGIGQRMTDAQATTKLAAVQPGSTPNVLGSISNDLVFTPIAPCRIADTRVAGGQIAANSTRGFTAYGVANYTAFGGSSTDCGLSGQIPSAVVLNVTAVLPAAAGYATVFAGDLASPPSVSSINYAAGAIVNNNVVVALNQAATFPDYKIYTLRAAQYVVDVVGYYDAPHATALDCTTVQGPSGVVIPDAGNFVFVATGNCPANYSAVTAECGTSGSEGAVNSLASYGCYFIDVKPGNGVVDTASASSVCCRVPGR